MFTRDTTGKKPWPNQSVSISPPSAVKGNGFRGRFCEEVQACICTSLNSSRRAPQPARLVIRYHSRRPEDCRYSKVEAFNWRFPIFFGVGRLFELNLCQHFFLRSQSFGKLRFFLVGDNASSKEVKKEGKKGGVVMVVYRLLPTICNFSQIFLWLFHGFQRLSQGFEKNVCLWFSSAFPLTRVNQPLLSLRSPLGVFNMACEEGYKQVALGCLSSCFFGGEGGKH